MLTENKNYIHGVEINTCIKEDVANNTALMYRPWDMDYIFVYGPEVEGDKIDYKALMPIGRFLTKRKAKSLYGNYLKRVGKEVAHDYKFANEKFADFVIKGRGPEAESYRSLIVKFLEFGYEFYPNKKGFMEFTLGYFPYLDTTKEKFMIITEEKHG